MNISLVIKESLRVENGTQYTNYQMNKISHKDKYYQKIGHNISLWNNMVISIPPSVMLLLSYGMINNQISKTINISGCLVSLHITGDQNFESELERRIQRLKPKLLKIESTSPDRRIFKMKLCKKRLELQTFQQLCSMISAYLDKMCVHILELPFLKSNGNAVFLFKKPIIRKTAPFCLQKTFFVMFGGCPYFLNKVLNNV